MGSHGWLPQWWLERHRDSAFVFIPSNRFRGSSIDAPKLVADSIKGILAPERARTRNADDKWRRHIQSDAFKAAAQGKMIIVVDGLNETPVADWLTILVDVWDQSRSLRRASRRHLPTIVLD